MTREQLLLGKIAEECAEVAQRALKAQQFGLGEVQEGQGYDNAVRIMHEFADLIGVVNMLQERGALPLTDLDRVIEKKAKVEHWIGYSIDLGKVER